MRAAIHVGLQKTASTMLQRNLNRNLSRLSNSGVGYVRLRPLNETEDTKHLPALTSTIRAIAIPKREAPDKAQVREELEWLRSQGHDTVILSDENTLGPINLESGKPAYRNAGDVVEWLVDTIHPESYRIILYVRRQDTYLESTYLHRIHVGKSIPFAKYMKRTDIDSLDWDKLATNIASRIGRGNLSVVPYETISRGELDFVNRFLTLTGAEIELEQDDLAERISNRSYSALALEMALRCNDLLKGADLRAFRDFLQDNYSNVTHPRPILLDDVKRADLVRRFAKSNEAMLRKFSSPQDSVTEFAG